MRRRRGVALIDFVIGTLIFSATILTFGSLTATKLDLLRASERMLHALGAAEAKIDAVRTRGLSAMPTGEADVSGFRLVERFVPQGLVRAEGVVEARALRMTAGDAHQLYEARVSVIWYDESGPTRVSLSTVAPLPLGSGQ